MLIAIRPYYTPSGGKFKSNECLRFQAYCVSLKSVQLFSRKTEQTDRVVIFNISMDLHDI